MAVALTPNPKFQAFDSNGEPLVGGKLFSFVSGTSTPLATYTDSSGITSNSNPTLLDARGEASVWLLAGSAYRLQLTDSTEAVTYWTMDGIVATTTDPEMTVATRHATVTVLSAGDVNTAWLQDIDSDYSFHSLIPDGWQQDSTLTLKLMRHPPVGTGGVVKMEANAYRMRPGTAILPLLEHLPADFTPAGANMIDLLSVAVPGTALLPGDAILWRITRLGSLVSDTYASTLFPCPVWLEYTGIAPH